MKTLSPLLESVSQNGFAIVRGLLDLEQVEELIVALSENEGGDRLRRRGEVFAVRNLLDASAEIRALANYPSIREIVQEVLGENAIPVRGILFDKTPGANWKVPWHQDVTIAVARRVEVEGYGPWSIKAGVLHVQPPACVLEGMLSIRVHLDDSDWENGALKVIQGSHLAGRIPEDEASRLGSEGAITVCEVKAGDALLMRPLLLHASSPAASPRHRRVIHVDYAAEELPAGMGWAFRASL